MEDYEGISLKGKEKEEYAFLDDPLVIQKLIQFTDKEKSTIQFKIPQIHCSSCVWLLEKLYKLVPGVQLSRVNFIDKTLLIHFDNTQTSLRKIVEVLSSVGYTPLLTTEEAGEDRIAGDRKKLILQIGVAGFVFGNIMLFSFPEYLGLENPRYKTILSLINLGLTIPVILYSGSYYFKSAWSGLRKNFISVDVPIALGISALFFRSVYEVITQSGPGYFDSLTGLIFFLLIGRWFQNRTYEQINFDRDYKSYFPLAATIVKDGQIESIALENLTEGDLLSVKNRGLIPADGILKSGKAFIDYSFVTGESELIPIEAGETVYAGGKQIGEVIHIEVTRKVSNSYLIQLWNENLYEKDKGTHQQTLADKMGKVFTISVITIALLTLAYWYIFERNPSVAWYAFTSVLIIACPCAIALALPFSYGNILRILAKNRIFLKNTGTIEQLQKVDTIVFDKTGTLTDAANSTPRFHPSPDPEDLQCISALASQSQHPLSMSIADMDVEISGHSVLEFREVPGQGIYGYLDGRKYMIGGDSLFIESKSEFGTGTKWGIDGIMKGVIQIEAPIRNGTPDLLEELKSDYNLALISGDNDRDKDRMKSVFGKTAEMRFTQKPVDKLTYIETLQKEGKRVMMVGDGLNDAGALRKSDVGVAITEELNSFAPASDVIIEGKNLKRLNSILSYARSGKKAVQMAYALAIIYNIIGLFFAVRGVLSPVIAAILMPASSITIVLFALISTSLFAKNRQIN